MACELAVEYKTLQLPVIITLIHDLTEPARHKEMAIEPVSYPPLQSPPVANCHRYVWRGKKLSCELQISVHRWVVNI